TTPPELLNVVDDLFRLRLASAKVHNHISAGFGESVSDLPADTPAGACHKSNLVLKDVHTKSVAHQAIMASSNSLARSSSLAGRGESLVTLCWGRVPATRAGMSLVV